MVAQYDPTKVSVVIGVGAGATIRGFADGAMITAEYTNDENTVHVGTDGQGRHIESADKSGQITVRLADYSPSNAVLTALHLSKVPFPVTVTDKTTTADLFFADSCKIAKRPPMEKSNEATMNEWVINFIRAEIVHSGAKSE